MHPTSSAATSHWDALDLHGDPLGLMQGMDLSVSRRWRRGC